MGKKVILLSLITVLLFSFSSFAQMNVEDQVELLRSAVKTSRKAIIAANVVFTEEESELFWPLYNEYRITVDKVNDRLLALIKKYAKNYESLSDEVASELMIESLDIEEDRLVLKHIYTVALLDVLPPRKVARFFQLENKMDAEVKYDLALSIPLAKPKEDTQN